MQIFRAAPSIGKAQKASHLTLTWGKKMNGTLTLAALDALISLCDTHLKASVAWTVIVFVCSVCKQTSPEDEEM